MKEIKLINIEKKDLGKVKLPKQFQEEVRPDLLKRAVQAINSHSRQAYGAAPRAGKGHSARLSKRRRKYRGSYGKGIARVPRKIMTRRGMQFNWVGAFAPGTVGGRRAFPPTAEKKWELKINDKERRKAIRSGLAASIKKEFIESRGHKVPELFPFIVDDSFEKLNKTKDVLNCLKKFGFDSELKRGARKKVRAGRGKLRGRKYKKAKSILIVAGDEKSAIVKCAKNIPGVDVSCIKNINAVLLAPGGVPGRLTLFTKSAIEKIEKEGLFV